MSFRFATKALRDLYTDRTGAKRYPPEVVAAFFKVMRIIDSAPSENEFRNIKGLHYEKLKGARGKDNERSMRLSGRWRLELTIESDSEGKSLLILRISPHYE